jgi:4-amino-4-deoxy-L-arabinose transferase-like glycosyltransferase
MKFRWHWPVAALLLGLMAAAMVTAAVQQTPTIDEPVYVGASVAYTHQHSLADNPEHPPLGKLLIGLGTLSARYDPGYTGSEQQIGRHLLYESGNDAQHLLLDARLPMIVLTLLFGLVVLAFATDLTGPLGGLVALALYAFSPDLIANGSLATLDLPAAGFLLTAFWLLWRARTRPALYLPLAALALGAALATKMSTLPAVPLVLLGTALSLHASRTRPREAAPPTATPRTADAVAAAPTDGGTAATPRGRVAVYAGAMTGVAVVAFGVVWLAYLAVDPRLRWATPSEVPAVGGLRGLVADWLPVPRAYADGMRIQFGFENRQYGGFLFGRQYVGSLWYYFPAALLVKTPLGMLALWLGGVGAMLAKARAAVPYVLLPPALLLVAALPGARDFGVRYVIVVPVFLAVAAAALVRLRWSRWAVPVLLAYVAVSSLLVFPYFMTYSNEAFGGPSKTHLRLHDSNVDWGQDLGRLADRLRHRYPGQPVWLVYKGSGLPSYYGIRARDPLSVPAGQVSGLLVVSDSSVDRAGPRLAALISGSVPLDEVGHSITIYRRPAPGSTAGPGGSAAARP